MTCDVKHCKRPSILIYAAFEDDKIKEVSVCEKHWTQHCDDEVAFNLRKHFKEK